MQSKTIRIGTRGSPLALVQAHEVRARLMAAKGLAEGDFEIVIFKTSGDRIQDRPLAELGGKGLFTKEIEEALIENRIDLAVHSMKDMATTLPEGLTIAAMLPREDVRDAFVSLKAPSLAALPPGAVVGTSSLRRAAQIRHVRPDLQIVGFRGNVETRLRKLAEGVADATLLAAAGLKRLGMQDRITAPISVTEMLPAVAQGAIGIEVRAEDAATRMLVGSIDHPATHLAVAAERTYLARLEGSCRTPIAGYARLEGNDMVFDGQILTPDGGTAHATRRQGRPERALDLANEAAEELLSRAGPSFFQGGA